MKSVCFMQAGQEVYCSAKAWMSYRLQSAVRWSRDCALPSSIPGVEKAGPGTQAGQIVCCTTKAWMPYRSQAKVKQELRPPSICPKNGETWLWALGWTFSVLYSKSLNGRQVISQIEADPWPYYSGKLSYKMLMFHAGSWSSTAQEEAQLNAS